MVLQNLWRQRTLAGTTIWSLLSVPWSLWTRVVTGQSWTWWVSSGLAPRQRAVIMMEPIGLPKKRYRGHVGLDSDCCPSTPSACSVQTCCDNFPYLPASEALTSKPVSWASITVIRREVAVLFLCHSQKDTLHVYPSILERMSAKGASFLNFYNDLEMVRECQALHNVHGCTSRVLWVFVVYSIDDIGERKVFVPNRAWTLSCSQCKDEHCARKLILSLLSAKKNSLPPIITIFPVDYWYI